MVSCKGLPAWLHRFLYLVTATWDCKFTLFIFILFLIKIIHTKKVLSNPKHPRKVTSYLYIPTPNTGYYGLKREHFLTLNIRISLIADNTLLCRKKSPKHNEFVNIIQISPLNFLKAGKQELLRNLSVLKPRSFSSWEACSDTSAISSSSSSSSFFPFKIFTAPFISKD